MFIWLWPYYLSWPGSDRGLGKFQSPITHCGCVIGKFSFTISDPVRFEVSLVFRATESRKIVMI